MLQPKAHTTGGSLVLLFIPGIAMKVHFSTFSEMHFHCWHTGTRILVRSPVMLMSRLTDNFVLQRQQYILVYTYFALWPIFRHVLLSHEEL